MKQKRNRTTLAEAYQDGYKAGFQNATIIAKAKIGGELVKEVPDEFYEDGRLKYKGYTELVHDNMIYRIMDNVPMAVIQHIEEYVGDDGVLYERDNWTDAVIDKGYAQVFSEHGEID